MARRRAAPPERRDRDARRRTARHRQTLCRRDTDVHEHVLLANSIAIGLPAVGTSIYCVRRTSVLFIVYLDLFSIM